jgi:hypothetical protein
MAWHDSARDAILPHVAASLCRRGAELDYYLMCAPPWPYDMVRVVTPRACHYLAS